LFPPPPGATEEPAATEPTPKRVQLSLFDDLEES